MWRSRPPPKSGGAEAGGTMVTGPQQLHALRTGGDALESQALPRDLNLIAQPPARQCSAPARTIERGTDRAVRAIGALPGGVRAILTTQTGFSYYFMQIVAQ